MSRTAKTRWGKPPWTIDSEPLPEVPPAEVDFAIVGAGFAGLAAAAWLRRLAPQKSVAVLEADHIGAGASGNTGGMVLAESSAGDLPGLGDVLGGFSATLRDLGVDAGLDLPGAWEIGRSGGLRDSPISWADSGTLRVVQEVPGGTADPGKLVSGLARAANRLGALICENTSVENIAFQNPLLLEIPGKQVRANCVLIATNAQSLELSGMAGCAEPKFTLAVATEPLTAAQLEVLGLTSRKSFYATDLPYLWGRVLPSNGIVFGSGLVHVSDWRELARIDIASGEAAELIARLERRVRGLDPVLKSIGFTHCWGGPILIAEGWRPVFRHHRKSAQAIVLGAFAGQGVALSVHLGRWAAEALLERRQLPNWND